MLIANLGIGTIMIIIVHIPLLDKGKMLKIDGGSRAFVSKGCLSSLPGRYLRENLCRLIEKKIDIGGILR